MLNSNGLHPEEEGNLKDSEDLVNTMSDHKRGGGTNTVSMVHTIIKDLKVEV